MPRTTLGRRAAPYVPPPQTGPVDVMYTGTQVGLAQTAPTKPSVATLQTLGVGSVRGIVQDTFTINAYLGHEAYFGPIREADIFTIVCINQQGSMGKTAWQQRVTDIASTIDPDGSGMTVYEIGNEPGKTFNYGSGTAANWNEFFNYVADASTVIRGMQQADGNPKKIICGAPLDTDTSAFFDAAMARNPKVSTLVDGFALHPYGHSNPYNRTNSKTSTINKIEAARDRLNANGASNKPIWITEMGWGAAGNTHSTMVALEDQVTTTTTQSHSLPTSTINVNSVTNFANSGRILFTAANQVVTYTGRNVGTNQFTGCTGGTGTIANGATISSIAEASPQVANTANETEQGRLLQEIFTTLLSRRNSNDLYLKNIGWFWYHDAPTVLPSPYQWWHYCGLVRADHTNRALGGSSPNRGSYTEFQAFNPTYTLT